MSDERSPSIRKPRILLAEDDDELRHLLQDLLTRRGYTIEAVADGAALLDKLAGAVLRNESFPADVVVTDIRMPGCSGLSIAHGLRDAGWKQPILILSAFADNAIRRRIQSLGVEFIAKPIDLGELEETLSRMCA